MRGKGAGLCTYISRYMRMYVCMHACVIHMYAFYLLCRMFILMRSYVGSVGLQELQSMASGNRKKSSHAKKDKNKSMMARFRLQATRIDRHVSVAEDDDVAYFARASILFRAFSFYRGCFPALAVGQYLFTTVY